MGEPFHYLRHAVSLIDCNAMVADHEGTPFFRQQYLKANESQSDVDTYLLEDLDYYAAIYARLAELLQGYADQHRIAVVGMTEPARLLRYGPGQHVGLHSDCTAVDPSKVSCLVHVGTTAYSGGELSFLNVHPPSLNQGDAIMFHSFVPHQVRPVLAGERWVLSAWFAGPPFR